MHSNTYELPDIGQVIDLRAACCRGESIACVQFGVEPRWKGKKAKPKSDQALKTTSTVLGRHGRCRKERKRRLLRRRLHQHWIQVRRSESAECSP